MGDGTVGFRFHPTDEELINHYLRNKMLGNESLVRAIKEVNLYRCEPWDLPEQSVVKSDDQVWYFFCARDYKYSNSKRANRTTKSGYWKATGKDRKIKAKRSNQEIGTKKTLVFYEGRAPKGVRTDWVIHEYHSTVTPLNQKAYVICKLKKKAGEKTGISSCNGDELSRPSHSYFENQSARNTTSEVDPQIQENLELFIDYDLALQSLAHSEEGISADYQYSSGFSNYNHNVRQSQVEITEQELEFVNSMLANQDESPCRETVYTLPNHYRPPKSLTRVHLENSSDTDAETSYARYVKTLETSSPVVSTKQMHVEDCFHYDDNRIPDSDSGESAKDGHFSINCIELVREESSVNTRTCKSQYQPKSINALTREGPEELQLLLTAYEAASRNKAREATERGTAVDPPKKKIFIKESKKEQKMAQETIGKTSMKSRSDGSTGSNCKGSFLETTQISHKPSPPSVYLLNVLVGVSLFIFFVREVVFRHS